MRHCSNRILIQNRAALPLCDSLIWGFVGLVRCWAEPQTGLYQIDPQPIRAVKQVNCDPPDLNWHRSCQPIASNPAPLLDKQLRLARYGPRQMEINPNGRNQLSSVDPSGSSDCIIWQFWLTVLSIFGQFSLYLTINRLLLESHRWINGNT